MKNVLGGENQNLYGAFPEVMSEYPEAKVHLYGKSVRSGRKVGHVNVTGPSESIDRLRRVANEAAAVIRDRGAAKNA